MAPPADRHRTVRSTTADWYSGLVYGTIVSLVAIGGLQFKTSPDALISGGVVLFGAVAIWLAHTVSQLVARQTDRQGDLTLTDVRHELRRHWPIILAALPAVLTLFVVKLGGWSVSLGLTVANVLGVLTLAGVGVATAGGAERSVLRRLFYVAWVTAAGVLVVALEVTAHHL